MENQEQDKLNRMNEKCLELEERIVFLEATVYKFRLSLSHEKVTAEEIKNFCEAIDDYFNTMEAIKNGNKIGLA